jgi:hypothetical protein
VVLKIFKIIDHRGGYDSSGRGIGCIRGRKNLLPQRSQRAQRKREGRKEKQQEIKMDRIGK